MKTLLFSILCLFASLVWAEQKIDTIQLNHRLAVEILSEVQAFLSKEATARAFNDYIIVQANPAELTQIKQLINQLDTPLQRLKVSVLRTDEKLSQQHSLEAGADLSINNEGTSAAASINAWSTNKVRNKDHLYQAQGIAGNPILISMGEDIPQQQQEILIFPSGAIAVQSSTDYISINNGFQAVARVLPNHQVIIDIHPRFAQLSKRNGIIQSSEIISSISGPVGTWIELGHIDNKNNIDKQGTTSYRSHRQLQQTIYIKVDPL